MMRRIGSRLAAVACILVSAAPLVAQDSLRAAGRRRTVAEDLQLFSQVFNQIRVNHPDSLDTHDLLMAAVAAMVQAADPHSYVIPAARLDSSKQAAFRAGKLVPVPITFAYVRGAPLVVSVDAPGAHLSLDVLPGDELVAADGRPIAAESAEELDLALAGPKGSDVTLALRRRRADGSTARLERRVRRERASPASAVPVATLLDPTTGYVRVTTFDGEKVADDLHAALETLEGRSMQRLVIDLRANGGGRVDEAKRIAGEFLPRGTIVYTSSGRKAEVTDTGRVQRSFWRSERRYPIVLLVDDGTASASELVAGALQDHDRALIVGRPTFGKSLIMQTFPLTDGSWITLVIGQVRTPCGRVIQRAYRGLTRREYYAEAGQIQDTIGRPSCRTDNGRVVYGGGGIVPDVLLPVHEAPAWLTRLNEAGTLLTWANGYASSAASSLTTIDALIAARSLPPAALTDFRTVASSAGVTVPVDAETETMLGPVLGRMVAFVKFGEAGYYRMVAVTDPAVRAAVDAFSKASAAGIGKSP